MMIKIEKVIGGYRVTLPNGESLVAKEVDIDEEEVNVKRTLYIEASSIEIDENGKVWIYTIEWALDNALFRHENRLIKIKGW